MATLTTCTAALETISTQDVDPYSIQYDGGRVWKVAVIPALWDHTYAQDDSIIYRIQSDGHYDVIVRLSTTTAEYQPMRLGGPSKVVAIFETLDDDGQEVAKAVLDNQEAKPTEHGVDTDRRKLGKQRYTIGEVPQYPREPPQYGADSARIREAIADAKAMAAEYAANTATPHDGPKYTTDPHIGIKPDAPWFINGRYWYPVSTQWRKGEGNNP